MKKRRIVDGILIAVHCLREVAIMVNIEVQDGLSSYNGGHGNGCHLAHGKSPECPSRNSRITLPIHANFTAASAKMA